MNTLKTKLILLSSIAFILLANSCSVEKLIESLECDSRSLFEEALVEKTFYQEALNAYAEDQNAENCQELRTSGSAYIQAVEEYIECSKEGDEEIKRELKEAKKALTDLGC